MFNRMKPPAKTHLSPFAIAILLGQCLAAATTAQLDLQFAPTATDVIPYPKITVIGRSVYLYSPVSPVCRLDDDGHREPDRRFVAPVGDIVTSLSVLPSGGWVVTSPLSAFVEPGDGSYFRLRGVDNPAGRPGDLLVQDDGSIVMGARRQRYWLDGQRDPHYGMNAGIEAASFDDGAGTSSSGGIGVDTAVLDSSGRLILGGRFQRVGAFERLGLARLRRDGSVDPDWNPGPGLGLRLYDTNYLSARPISLSPGPSGSLLVGMQLVSTNGKPSHRFYMLDASGHIERSFPSQATASDPAPVVQPDGQILVAGNFGNWSEQKVSGFIRLQSDGSLDPGFAVGFGDQDRVFFSSLVLDQSGRALIGGGFTTVNGVARPGLARVLAYDPPVQSPTVTVSSSRDRIATNEVLYLTARVTGFPPPELQWYRDGEVISGATNRGLRLPVAAGTALGTFRLVADNDSGSSDVTVAEVTLAVRSPQPGLFDPGFDHALTNFSGVTQLVPLGNGGLLVGAGRWDPPEEAGPRVGRLLPGGGLDSAFGENGVVDGKGMVEGMVPLADGGILVVGQLTELAGKAVSGMAQLDRDGRLVPRPFPDLDVPHVSAVMPLPEGGMIIAGRFTRVGLISAYRLARLSANLVADPSFVSPLEQWQFVDAIALDSQGRLLIAGERIYTDVTLTNAPATGLQRLREDGSPDPQFRRLTAPVRNLFVEPEGTLLVGMPARRLTEDGEVVGEFSSTGLPITSQFSGPAFDPDHRMVRLPDGGVVFPMDQSLISSPRQLIRWAPDGSRDFNFVSVTATNAVGPIAQAMTLLSDGSVVIAMRRLSIAGVPDNLEASRRLVRLLPDSDHRLVHPRLADGGFEADLATQPGIAYEIHSRDRLDSTGSSPVDGFTGDGYLRTVAIPALGDRWFLELRRE